MKEKKLYKSSEGMQRQYNPVVLVCLGFSYLWGTKSIVVGVRCNLPNSHV